MRKFLIKSYVDGLFDLKFKIELFLLFFFNTVKFHNKHINEELGISIFIMIWTTSVLPVIITSAFLNPYEPKVKNNNFNQNHNWKKIGF